MRGLEQLLKLEDRISGRSSSGGAQAPGGMMMGEAMTPGAGSEQ